MPMFCCLAVCVEFVFLLGLSLAIWFEFLVLLRLLEVLNLVGCVVELWVLRYLLVLWSLWCCGVFVACGFLGWWVAGYLWLRVVLGWLTLWADGSWFGVCEPLGYLPEPCIVEG